MGFLYNIYIYLFALIFQDLVKKHLMSAVNTEVDELKEQIKELKEELRKLQLENEALRMFLTPEQINAYQQQKVSF